MTARSLRVFATVEELNRHAAQVVVDLVGQAIARRERCTLVLSGGNTPRGVYQLLAAARYRDQIDWRRLDIFWGDERCVPQDDPASNYHMAQETLLARVPIPPGAIHRICGELPPAEAAAAYEEEIWTQTGGRAPRFDAVLLGMGTDGHTASLFPDTPHLLDERRLVVPTVSPTPPRNRVSLSLRALNLSRHVVFLVAGEGKAPMVARVLRANARRRGGEPPATLVRPPEGRLLWMLDQAAAAGLSD